MQTTYIMTEEYIGLIYSCFTYPNLSHVGRPEAKSLEGLSPAKPYRQLAQADPPAPHHHPLLSNSKESSCEAPPWTPCSEFIKSGINHI